MTEWQRQELKQVVQNLRRGKIGDVSRPYKDILLISLLDGSLKEVFHENTFPFTDRFERTFEHWWRELVPYIDYNIALLELPYFYLQGDGIWELKIKSGQEETFSSHQRITRRRILECVEYGTFKQGFFELVKDADSRKYLVDLLITRL